MQRLLSFATAGAVACTAIGTMPAVAQERQTVDTLDQRLSRIERVLDQSLVNVVQQIGGLQSEIRELRGEIERLDFELENANQRDRDLYRDTDDRLSALEQGGGGGLPGLDELEALGPDGGAGQAGGAATSGEGSLAVIVPGDDASGAAGSERAATAAEQAAYTEAYDLLATGAAADAAAAFDGFIESYPDGPYTDNAYYWRGEAMYALRRFDDALASFNEVTERFPNSTKTPDARLKIGFTRFEQGDYDEARSLLESVENDYPDRSASVLARKRLQQMDRDGL